MQVAPWVFCPQALPSALTGASRSELTEAATDLKIAVKASIVWELSKLDVGRLSGRYVLVKSCSTVHPALQCPIYLPALARST